jgi:hypothetical protein
MEGWRHVSLEGGQPVLRSPVFRDEAGSSTALGASLVTAAAGDSRPPMCYCHQV